MNKKPTKGISVDAGTQGNPGLCFYRVVDIANGIQLGEKNLGEGTNNLAEFIGLVNAIKECVRSHKLRAGLYKTSSEPRDLYTDSQTALAWLRRKDVKTSFSGPILLEVSKCIVFLNSDEYANQKAVRVFKWNTKEWGEIPADFGRKSGGKSVPIPVVKEEKSLPYTEILLKTSYTLNKETKEEIEFLLNFYNKNK